MDQYQLFVILVPFALASSAGVMLYAWRQRTRPVAKMLALMMLPVCGYLITNTLELIDPTQAGTLFWARAGYWFAPMTGVMWVAFALEYTGKRRWLTQRRFWMLLTIPIVTALLVQTNDLHHLIWTSTTFTLYGNFLALSVIDGPWSWVNTFYSYLLLLLGAALVAREYFYSFHTYRQQTVWLILGMVVPLIQYVIVAYHLIPDLQKDYSPIGFAISGAAFAVGIFRYQLLDLAPIARSLVMDTIEAGICVIEPGGYVVDVNPALQRILRKSAVDLIGQPAREALPFWKEMQGSFWGCVVELGARSFELSSNDMSTRRGKHLGQIIMLHDVTERKRLMTRVEQLAITDVLTGLHNRRYFMERLTEEMERSLRLKHALTLLMVDLDFFKKINDTFGHSVGDEVLIKIASGLQRSLRKIDFAARYGGEEFLVLLPETGLEEALKICERIRVLVMDTPFQTNAGPFHVTVSIGAASVAGGEHMPVDELIRCADQAMYHAKHLGRNRVYPAVVI